MMRDRRKIRHIVRKRTFDEYRRKPAGGSGTRPKFARFRSVARKSDHTFAVIDDKSVRRNFMIYRKRRHAQMPHIKSFPGFERPILKYFSVIVLQLGKIRIHVPIKNVALKYFDNFGRRMYHDRRGERCEKVVDKKRQAHDVIQMRVSQNDVANLLALPFRRRYRQAARIERDYVVDHKA